MQGALDWSVWAQKEDGGQNCLPTAHGTLSCWEGLAAFAALPWSQWTRAITECAERGPEFYLRRRLYREGRDRYVPWLRFHYPVHYYYDLLVGLDVIPATGHGDDPRLDEAL